MPVTMGEDCSRKRVSHNNTAATLPTIGRAGVGQGRRRLRMDKTGAWTAQEVICSHELIGQTGRRPLPRRGKWWSETRLIRKWCCDGVAGGSLT